jgi:hypothetical protein
VLEEGPLYQQKSRTDYVNSKRKLWYIVCVCVCGVREGQGDGVWEWGDGGKVLW